MALVSQLFQYLSSYLPGTRRVEKKSAAVQKITEWVAAQHHQERTTSISDEEMLMQVRVHCSHLLAG